MKNQDVIEKDGELYLSPKAVLVIIIDEAINETELISHIRCRKIIKEISKLMALRRYGGGATEIFNKIMKLQEPTERKDFVSNIYNKYVYLEDIDFLLSNIKDLK